MVISMITVTYFINLTIFEVILLTARPGIVNGQVRRVAMWVAGIAF